jgi:hypothetical protein
MKIHKGTVVNCVQANTRWGERLCLNCKLLDSKKKVACWSTDLNNSIYLSKKPGDIVELIQDDKNKFSLLDRETSQAAPSSDEDRRSEIVMSRPSNNGSEGSYYTYNNNPTSSKEKESILDLPVLSDIDKRKMMEYVRSQSKLLKFCYETICQDFPTLEEYDSRGARSLAITLLIAANQARDKYMK